MRHDIIRNMRIDEIAPDFELPDLDGQLHRLSDHRGRVVVMNFWSCNCPHSVRTDDLIRAWRERWGEAVEVLTIAPNANESPMAMAAVARERRLPMILVDAQHVVADLYAAQTTPEVCVIDRQGRLRYRGAVDDTSFAQRTPKRFFLEQAVAEVLAGESLKVSETRSYGCAIVREALE